MDDGGGGDLSQVAYEGDCLQEASLTGLGVDLNYRFAMRGSDASNNKGALSNMVGFNA